MVSSSPSAKYITEPEVVFEEHEVNEDIQPVTAFESDKEIGKVLPLLRIALYVCLGFVELFSLSAYMKL